MEPGLPAHTKTYTLDTFQDDLKQICGGFAVTSRARPRALAGHLSVTTLAGLDLAQVGLEADRIERTRAEIRQDPGDHFFLIMQREGQSVLAQNDIAEQINPGDMFLVDATQESLFRYDGRYSLQLSVHLPRGEMCHRFGRRIYGGLKIDRDDPFSLSMRALLAKLCEDVDNPQTHVVEAFYSVFGAMLTDRAAGGLQTINPDRLIVQRALTNIADNFHDCDFSTSSLADLTGVSLRSLQRAFRLIDATPHERLQNFRVAAARELLIANQSKSYGLKISSVAYQCGFADLSTFYRLYRKAYGHAPGQQGLTL